MRDRYLCIASYIGLTLGLAGAAMLVPLVALLPWPEEAATAPHFLVPALVLIAGGSTIYFRCRRPGVVLSTQDGGLIVVASWIGACVSGAWPLMACEDLSFTQGIFESVSGWTTTGLSVIDVSKVNKITLLWRSITQVIGGAGFAIIMLAALTRPSDTSLPSAEGRSEQLVPQVRESARLVVTIYCAYLAVGSVALFLAGMDWFDAINHSFCAVSTGGFSTRPESIGHWDSPVIEAVTLPLMFLGSLNFVTAYAVWRGRLASVRRDSELRLVIVLFPVAALVLFIFVCRELYPTLGKGVRVAIFEAMTCMTTTGYSTVSFADWGALGVLVIIALMVIGGGTGSTAGGVKQYRIVLLTKSFVWELRRALLPKAAVVENSIWHSGEREYIDDARLRQVTAFATLYIFTLVGGTAVIAAHGYPLEDALFEFASAQGTVGLSVGVTAADAPPLVLWAEIGGMFLGRLEFLIVFVGLVKLFREVPRAVK